MFQKNVNNFDRFSKWKDFIHNNSWMKNYLYKGNNCTFSACYKKDQKTTKLCHKVMALTYNDTKVSKCYTKV